MKPIAAPIVRAMITSTIHVPTLVPVFFAIMKERALRRGTLRHSEKKKNCGSSLRPSEEGLCGGPHASLYPGPCMPPYLFFAHSPPQTTSSSSQRNQSHKSDGVGRVAETGG
jgi:hypothetical protein